MSFLGENQVATGGFEQDFIILRIIKYKWEEISRGSKLHPSSFGIIEIL